MSESDIAPAVWELSQRVEDVSSTLLGSVKSAQEEIASSYLAGSAEMRALLDRANRLLKEQTPTIVKQPDSNPYALSKTISQAVEQLTSSAGQTIESGTKTTSLVDVLAKQELARMDYGIDAIAQAAPKVVKDTVNQANNQINNFANMGKDDIDNPYYVYNTFTTNTVGSLKIDIGAEIREALDTMKTFGVNIVEGAKEFGRDIVTGAERVWGWIGDGVEALVRETDELLGWLASLPMLLMARWLEKLAMSTEVDEEQLEKSMESILRIQQRLALKFMAQEQAGEV